MSPSWGAAACEDFASVQQSGQDRATAPVGEVGSSGMALIVDVPAETDVVAIRLDVQRVACPGEALFEPADFTVIADLEGPMPGDLVPGALAAGLDADDEYFFSDEFWVLPAGCYDVAMTPLDENGDPSGDCAGASAEGVVVHDGLTTEVMLVGECRGTNDPVGGLDVIGVLDLNHPPQIVDLEFDPSKFARDCNGVLICVDATDADGDDLQFVLEQTAGPAIDAPVVEVHQAIPNGLRVCWRVVPPSVAAYEFRVTVYDLHEDATGVAVIDPASYDDLSFPFYSLVDCPGPECVPGDAEACNTPDGRVCGRVCEPDGTWGDCTCPPQECVPGETGPCDTADGRTCEHTCLPDGTWGACECPPQECGPNDMQACDMPDGRICDQACLPNGTWGQCSCPPPECAPNEVEACNMPDGRVCDRACLPNGTWDDCSCPPQECNPGDVGACGTPDGRVCDQICLPNGTWGSCDCPPPECAPGDEADCQMPDGRICDRACLLNGTWGSCECPPQECAPNEVASCDTPDGRTCDRTCRPDGTWGSCDCPPQECAPNEMEDCNTPDGRVCDRTCRPDGTWGACSCPPQECAPNEVEDCNTPDGRLCDRTCRPDGTWGACSCPPQECVPGELGPCTGDGGCSGERVCLPDGTWDDTCICPPEPGCSVTFMFYLSNAFVERPVAEAFADRAVEWLAGVGTDPRVCVVLDDNHLNDNAGDAAYIHQLLVGMGYDATLANEPPGGLAPADIAGCDVVWFTNPSQPVDDAQTVVTLMAFMRDGGDLIMSGDDLSRETFVPMGGLTHTENVNDGRMTCGFVTDNNAGPGYRVDIANVNHPIIDGFQGGAFRYGDDMDHAVTLSEGEEVLAWARLYCHPQCALRTPAIIAYCP